MTLTDETIKVTHQMMQENNMTRGSQYGIPVEPKDPSKGLIWKSMSELKVQDLDALEEYFLLKQNKNK
jgi:hypothetical protein